MVETVPLSREKIVPLSGEEETVSRSPAQQIATFFRVLQKLTVSSLG